jgi:predicted aspartyl protease
MLLLDTGASQIVLFREIADRLNFIAQQKGVAQVAGGNTIYSELGRVDSFKVGPIAMRNVGVLVINHEGPPLKHSGMLGMTFLRNLEYSIDFKNQVIRWRPPAK